MRILILTIVILCFGLPAIANETHPANMTVPRHAVGEVLRAQKQYVDTYAISLGQADGVTNRDVFDIRRQNKIIAQGMVILVSADYSLVSLIGANVNVRVLPGDEAVLVRHADVPVTKPASVPSGEVIHMTDRNTGTNWQMPSGGGGGGGGGY